MGLPRRNGLLLALCLVIAAIEGYDIQAFGVTAPAMAAEFDLRPDVQGWLGAAAMFGLVLGAFVGGHLSDRFGRRWVLSASILTFGVFSIATMLAPNIPLLFVARVAAGFGFGGTTPNLIAIAADIAPPRRRALTVTTIFCGLPAGAALVAHIVSVSGDALPWRSIYLMGGLAPLLLVPAVLWLVPRKVTAVRAEDPIGNFWLLLARGRRQSALLIWFVFAITLFLAYVMLNWLPSLVIAKGLSGSVGATAAMTFNLASIVGGFVIAAAVDRLGFRFPMTVSYALLFATFAIMGFSQDPGWILVLSAAAGFLIVGPQCALYALVTAIYPQSIRVLGAGAAVGMGRLGSILGPVAAGTLREAGFSASQTLLMFAPLALVAAASTFVLGRTVEEVEQDSPATAANPLAVER